MGAKHNAKYVVTLTSEERKELLELVKKGKAAAHKIKHANILLASDENGENLPAATVAKTDGMVCGEDAIQSGRLLETQL